MKTIREIRHQEINSSKRYCLPEKTTIVRYNGYILVIANETANWIVLENDSQLEFFELLKGFPLNEALDVFKGNMIDAQKTVIQRQNGLKISKQKSKQVEGCIFT